MQDNKTVEKNFTNVTLVRTPDQTITLPEGMALTEGATWLRKLHDYENTDVCTFSMIDCFPTEGVVALARVLDEKFGFFQQVATYGMFGEKNPPQMIHVQTGPFESIQAPWGRIEIPGIDGHLNTGVKVNKGKPVFVLSGETIKRYEHIHQEIADAVKVMVKEHSIYRGHAVELRPVDVPEDFNPFTDCPQYLTLGASSKGDVIFSRSVEEQIQTSLFAPVENIDALRESKIPFKRGVLLAGDYGTGKSLTAKVTASLCKENGITFVKIKQAAKLAHAVEFARMYQPAVVFAEDIDRVVQGDRTEAVDEILNTVDGIDSKNTEILVVLTTNALQSIHEAMLRPGRIDAIIHVTAPDAEAVQRLIQMYGYSLVHASTDISEASAILEGQNPAIIRECVERAKLSAINERRTLSEGLTGADLAIAARGIIEQRKLVIGSRPSTVTPAEKMGREFGSGLGGYVVEAVERVTNGKQEPTTP